MINSTEIIDTLAGKNVTIKDIRTIFNVKRSVIYKSIYGEGSRRIRVFIAVSIAIKPTTLWGKDDKYHTDDALYLKQRGEL